MERATCFMTDPSEETERSSQPWTSQPWWFSITGFALGQSFVFPWVFGIGFIWFKFNTTLLSSQLSFKEHTPSNVFTIAFSLGLMASLGINLFQYASIFASLGLYVTFLCYFHFLEYFCTSLSGNRFNLNGTH